MLFDWSKFVKSLVPALLAALLAGLGVAVPVKMSGCPKGDGGGQVDPPEPGPTPDPVAAIGKVVMQGGHCSGTVVGPRGKDGRYKIVSAAHCFKRVGESAQFIPRDGRPSFQITCDAIDRRADIAVCSMHAPSEQPFVLVADATPPVGTAVLHAGFGVDRPANVEHGQILALPNKDGQVRFRLSVSPGDSGGGICWTEEGHLLAPVCCTDRLAGVGNVWGGGPEVINRMLANPTQFIDVPPVPMPEPREKAPPVEMPAAAELMWPGNLR